MFSYQTIRNKQRRHDRMLKTAGFLVEASAIALVVHLATSEPVWSALIGLGIESAFAYGAIASRLDA